MSCPSKLIIGIDPSISGTCVCMGSSPDSYAIKRFPSKPVEKGAASRIARYERTIGEVMAWASSQVARLDEGVSVSVFIEDYAFSAKNNAAFSGEYGGLLRWHLIDLGPVCEVPVLTLKKYITGVGAGKKELMIAHISKNYQLTFDTDDHYDAFGLFQLGLAYEGQVDALNAAQRDVLAKLKSRLKGTK